MGGSFRSRGWGIVDARRIAASWARPYTSVQRAWVDALGVPPAPAPWEGGRRGGGGDHGGTPARHAPGVARALASARYAGARALMSQKVGVRG